MKNDFHELVLWSEQEYSLLPWRQNRTLYTTLVSEIMLQQTTVGTVLNRYDDFIKQFPQLDDLANADDADLRSAWQGLGYYRRAVNLLKAAKAIHQNDFPKDEEELIKIPGIGPYTASAIRAIGHDLPALAVDGNLKRVLSRYFNVDTPYEKGLDTDLRELANKKQFGDILKKNGPRRVNEALMDLGRTICKPTNPLCLTCPLNNTCKAFKKGNQALFPVKINKKKTKVTELHLLRYICLEEKQILLYQKRKGEWLESQWELPTSCISCPEEDFKQYPPENQRIPESKLVKSSITRYKIHNYPFSTCKNVLLENIPQYKQRELKFFPMSDLPLISTASIKILKNIKLL